MGILIYRYSARSDEKDSLLLINVSSKTLTSNIDKRGFNKRKNNSSGFSKYAEMSNDCQIDNIKTSLLAAVFSLYLNGSVNRTMT